MSSSNEVKVCGDKSILGWAATPGCKGTLQKWSYHLESTRQHPFLDRGMGLLKRPAIPRQEIVGTVAARGDKTDHQIGDRVGVGYLASSCRGTGGDDLCEWCKKDEGRFCPKKFVTFDSPYQGGRGGISEGGFVDRIRVYDDFAFKSK